MHTNNHGGVGPQPLHCLQMLISVNIFLEGDKGVKERSLQIDQVPPKIPLVYSILDVCV